MTRAYGVPLLPAPFLAPAGLRLPFPHLLQARPAEDLAAGSRLEWHGGRGAAGGADRLVDLALATAAASSAAARAAIPGRTVGAPLAGEVAAASRAVVVPAPAAASTSAGAAARARRALGLGGALSLVLPELAALTAALRVLGEAPLGVSLLVLDGVGELFPAVAADDDLVHLIHVAPVS